MSSGKALFFCVIAMNESSNDILIAHRDDLRQCNVLQSAVSSPGDGEALLCIETFGLYSENFTYRAFIEGRIDSNRALVHDQ